MNNKKIVKYVAVGFLTASLAAGVGLHLYDSNINHLHVYCPLNNILGVNHQIHKINNDYGVYGINAYYEEEGIGQEYIDPIAVKMEDGSIIYKIPAGYKVEDGVGVRTIRTPERIVVAQGTPIYPEGSKPGDLVKKSDIEVVNMKDIYAIPVPKKSK